MFFIGALASALSLSYFGLREASAAKPPNPGGYQTLCEASGSRNATGTTSVSLTEKIRQGLEAGKDPIRTELSSTLGSGTVASIVAPASGYLLDSIVLRVASNADCNISGADFLTFNFSGPGAPISVDSDDDDSDTLKLEDILPSQEDVFNALKVPLGYGDESFPTEENSALVEAVCTWIKDQIDLGQTEKATTAGAIGALAGSMQADLMRCMSESSLVNIVNADNTDSTCTGDNVATTLTYALLSGAPAVSLKVESNGDGTYTVTNIDANDTEGFGTTATATISGDGSCVVDADDFSVNPP
jgi:hypothetical protein